MARGWAALAGVALLLGAVWVVPGWLDWSRYRENIAALLSDDLGRPVRIAGAITLRLLPQPALTAAGLSVDDVGDGVVLRAEAAQLRVALGPLLAGTVVVRELVLQGADLTLPWPPGPGTLGQRPPAWLSNLQARIEHSIIHVGNVQLKAVDARLETDTETGTLTAAGAGQIDSAFSRAPASSQTPFSSQAPASSQAWRFSIRLARPGRDGVAPIEASIDGLDRLRETGIAFSGQISGDGALAGRVNGRGPNLSLLLPAPALAWRADGRLSAAGGRAIADDLAMELDGAPARGTVAVRIGDQARVDVAIMAGRLDLDAWAPVLARPQVFGLPVGIDLSVESATLSGGVLRQMRGAFDLEADGVAIHDVVVRLPGDAQLGLNGRLANSVFNGVAQLTAPDLATTLRWATRIMPLGTVWPDLPGGVLQTATVSGQVHAGPDALALIGISGSLDGAGVSGSARLQPGPVPVLALALQLDRWTLDPWLLLRPPATGVDWDVQIAARAAQWRGIPIKGLAVDVRWTAGRQTLRRLEGTVAGLYAQASGTMVGGGTEPQRLQDGRVDLSAADGASAAPFLRSLTSQYGWDVPAILLTGPLNATLSASGMAEALQAKLSLAAGDLRIEAAPLFDAGGGWAGPVTLRHPGATRLLRAFGIDAAWLGEGSLSLVAMGRAGSGGPAMVENAVLVAGGLRGKATLRWDGAALTGSAAFERLPIPEPTALDGWPGRRLQGWQADVAVTAAQVTADQTVVLQDAAAQFFLLDGRLALRNGSALWRGAPATLSATVDATSTPARLTGQASLTALRLDPDLGAPMSGMLTGSITAAATGQSAAALIATLSGQAQVRVRDGVLRGVDLPALNTALVQPGPEAARAGAQAAMVSGQTQFDALEMSAAIRDGLGTLSGTLTAPGGTARLQGSADIPAGLLDAVMTLQPEAAPVSVSLRLLGPAMTPRRIPDLTGLSRWLTDRP